MKYLHRFAILCCGLVPVLDSVFALSAAQSPGQEGPPIGNFERCRPIPDAAMRLRCYEEADPASIPKPQSGASQALGGWRLVRTPNPAGGRDAVSIMQTADMANSDPDLAGLMLRCGERNVETLLVLVRPFPPRARPKVTVVANSKRAEFIASVVPPGVALLFPPEATSLATTSSRYSDTLAVEIADDPPVRGVVPIAGLAPAYQLLTANCGRP